jgi:hypothetical protein
MAETANSMGAQCIFDGENPRVVTAIAREVISGGTFVEFSGTSAGCVGSDATNFAVADLEVCKCTSPNQVNGLALQNTASGGYCSVATRGAFLVRAYGPVSGGMAVIAIVDGVANVAAGTTGSICPIGRALSSAGSEAYCLVDLLL